jgi:LysM repeat protein
MAKQQRKEPWNSEMTKSRRTDASAKNDRDGKKSKESKGTTSTVFLTILVIIMFAIIGAAIVFTVWNARSVNDHTVAQQFYPIASSQAVASESASQPANLSASSASDNSSSSSSSDTIYTVVAGDYPSLIASKTGLSWTKILQLNPTLDPNNPGYYKDGSQLTAGQTLKIK